MAQSLPALFDRRLMLLGGGAGLGSLLLGHGGWANAQMSNRRLFDPKGGKVVDFHTHILDPLLPVVDHMDAAGGATNLKFLEEWLSAMRSPEAHIRHMDSYGVDAHVVGISNAEHGISWGDPTKDLRMYRASNDRLKSNWVDAHPGRFFGACGVPANDVKLAVEELTRAVYELGFKVLQVSSSDAFGTYYGDPSYDPLWAAVRDMGVTVFIHPHNQNSAAPLDKYALSNSLGQGIEEVKVMASIMYNGVFDKFPGVKIVVAHGGGFLPHYYGRMDRNARERPWTVKNMKKRPSEYLKDFFYDTCVYDQRIISALVQIVGVSRLTLGTDFPVGDKDPYADLHENPGISLEALEEISIRTPSKLLDLSA